MAKMRVDSRGRSRPKAVARESGGDCPACGAPMRARRGRLSLPIHRERTFVADVPHLRCTSCGKIVLRWSDAGVLEAGAFSRYREKHGLLSPSEIRELRRRLRLTRARLARLLRVDAPLVARWETSRFPQQPSHDALLRLIRDSPESRGLLRRRAA